MGQHDVDCGGAEDREREFMRAVLRDLEALERMLVRGRFEVGMRRIGAEQELILVDDGCGPAPVGPEVLADLSDPRVTTELARFNLELNLTPRRFSERGLSALEAELTELMARVRVAAAPHGARPFLCGIAPTLALSDLSLANLTPVPRYRALNDAVKRMHGGAFRCHIKGLDELDVAVDDVMLEAVNTSFQVHYQTDPDSFASDYNAAQLATAPVLAVAVNAPRLFGKSLWAETRIPVFQHAIDARTCGQQRRGHRARVDFGERWVARSPLELFREDVARFRPVLTTDVREDPLAVLAAGDAPELRALRLFNGTVYRWNRPCYGVVDGCAHLRVEARALPAGPTVLDACANAAFFVGLVAGLTPTYGDVARLLPFDDARANFYAAARYGLDAQLHWPGLGARPAASLVADTLVPIAAAGLASLGVGRDEASRYLDVIEERARTGRTGAAWISTGDFVLRNAGVPAERRARLIVKSALEQADAGKVVARFDPPRATGDDLRASYRTVGQFMTTDLRTLRPGDHVDLAAALMDWVHVRHIPVEDEAGALVGVVTHRAIVRLFARGAAPTRPVAVHEIMKRDPLSVPPSLPTLEAMRLMRRRGVGCLPVVDEGRLVGLVTERDFIRVAEGLLEARLGEVEPEPSPPSPRGLAAEADARSLAPPCAPPSAEAAAEM
jgi:CBS domain-containing protein